MKIKNLNPNEKSVTYKLVSILIHKGSSIKRGHYYSCIKTFDENWYLFNDEKVKKINENEVFKQEAYLLFYQKVSENDNEYNNKIKPLLLKENIKYNNDNDKENYRDNYNYIQQYRKKGNIN